MHRHLAALAVLLAGAAALATPCAAGAETVLERGAYLVRGIGTCGNCHSYAPPGEFPSADRPLSGGNGILAPVFRVYPPNITPDPVHGIGAWSEDQIVTALRTGHRPNGSTLHPPMPVPYLAHLADSDAHAIAVYLKSLPPDPTPDKPAFYAPKVPWPTGYGPPPGHITAPPETDKVAYGAYLSNPAHCMECHTPQLPNGQIDRTWLGAGGRIFSEVGLPNNVSANITEDKATGIGTWTDAQIKHALTTGERPDGRILGRPMPWYFYQNLTNDDLDALVAWLRTIKPVVNKVARPS